MPMQWPRNEALDRTADQWAKAATETLQRAKRAALKGHVAEAERYLSHAQYFLRRAEAAQRR